MHISINQKAYIVKSQQKNICRIWFAFLLLMINLLDFQLQRKDTFFNCSADDPTVFRGPRAVQLSIS